MKRFALALVLVSLAACSKTVTKDGNKFFQENPIPAPSETPNPNPSTSPIPTPIPTDPIGCEPNRLGELWGFSLYVKGDLNLNHVDAGKRVAAFDATVSHGTIGDDLPVDSFRADLASAGKLTVSSVQVPNGKATYGSLLDKVRSSALGGFVNAPTDLRANLRKIFEFSNACGGAPANTGITRTCRHGESEFGKGASPENCTIRITGENHGLNIAELSEAQIANVRTYIIDIPYGSTLVTNLPQNRSAQFKQVTVKFAARQAASPSEARIFWNFPSIEYVEFVKTEFKGTVVAPDASIDVSGQHGEAAFWVREFKGSDSDW